ncbi:MAG: glutaminyl-peptide cyclotransferase [Candidatus Bathyarchaeota archaeon]|nr:glutaminyl-peptide cyclotransferase [Candidatus Bathyarchaeota archaeon]
MQFTVKTRGRTVRQKIALVLISSVLVSIPVLSMYFFTSNDDSSIRSYTYHVVNTFPHDPQAFTQGLCFYNDFLYESTGLFNLSSLRQVELETGTILQNKHLPGQYFGEGITIIQDKIVQLTWKSNIGFVYDLHTFALLQNFSVASEGWGLTYDGQRLIMSDGTATLSFLDSETFEKIGEIHVQGTKPVDQINELEYIQGEVFANIWRTDNIARINPETGQVIGWLDLSELHETAIDDPNNVLNGIAYDAQNDRIFVTGKRWSYLYEIQLVPKNSTES